LKVRYRFTRAARGDLKRIANYWKKRASAETAHRLIAGIFETIVMLATQPRCGARRDDRGPEIRVFPSKRFLIYYVPHRSGIQIVHIFDGSQDQSAAWRSEP